MQLFNEESFSALLTRCYENAEYQGVVMLASEAQKIDFVDELLRNHTESPITGIKQIIVRLPNTYVEFENGSEIEIITPRDLRRMGRHRFNEALLDSDILDFDAIDALQRLICDYNTALAQGVRRRRLDDIRAQVAANARISEFDKQYVGVWGDMSANTEIKYDKRGQEAMDIFLNSFKINDSLEHSS